MVEEDGGREWYVISRKEQGETDDSKAKELEAVLEREYALVIIEPWKLGDHVIHWIKGGNFLHKSSVLSNLGALALIPFVPREIVRYTVVPLGVFGVLCGVIYNVSWYRDPCCKYQVDYNGEELSRVPSRVLSTRSPVILVRRNDTYRVILHSTLSVFVTSFFCWKLYKSYF